MPSFFNNVTYDYNLKTKRYHFHCSLGIRPIRAMVKNTSYTEKKLKIVFNKFNTLLGFEVHEFYILDVYHICKALLELGSSYYINIKTVNNLFNIIKTEILKEDAVKDELKLDIDSLQDTFIYKPLKNQIPAYENYLRIRHQPGSRGMLLDGGVGVGKTYISLSIAYFTS